MVYCSVVFWVRLCLFTCCCYQMDTKGLRQIAEIIQNGHFDTKVYFAVANAVVLNIAVAMRNKTLLVSID